jgi:Holliday junction DNA helicase RuvA
MIGRISGTLLEKNPPSLLLNVQGVGYEVDVPMSTFYGLPSIGEAVELHTHFVVREDAQLLFGFGSKLERSVFRTLLKVNGVGAKVALSILSGMTTDELFQSIAQKDAVPLTRVPGIGKKTAERLVVELQDKVDALAGGSVQAGLPETVDTSTRMQAEDALLALGYKSAEAKRLLDKNSSDGQSVEEMIRAALRGVSLSK